MSMHLHIDIESLKKRILALSAKVEDTVQKALDKGENLFLDERGWNARYVPAVQQRGPFIIGLHRSDTDPDGDTLTPTVANEPLHGTLDLLDDGGVDAYAAIHNMLDAVLRGSLAPAEAPAAVEDVDPARLWSWISLRAARGTRAAITGRRSAAAALSDLQRQADHNRRLASTPVRGDLLLQDWLIQWARLKP